MPKDDRITLIAEVLETALIQAMDVTEPPVLEGELREALSALGDLKNEVTEYPWTDGGPTVEEAGGESILVRLFGDRMTAAFWVCRSWRAYGPHAEQVLPVPVGTIPPIGWRRMPKAKE